MSSGEFCVACSEPGSVCLTTRTAGGGPLLTPTSTGTEKLRSLSGSLGNQTTTWEERPKRLIDTRSSRLNPKLNHFLTSKLKQAKSRLFGGHDTSFVFINQTMSWAAAQSFCRQHHTDLASVRSSSEWEQIQVLVQSAGQNAAWIGLFRNSWSWSDGSNVTFSHWRPTEPNGHRPEDCVRIYDDGLWNDCPCGNNEKSEICPYLKSESC
uniref:C-type lectin domain-containing protein n=1 Tax=Poecilia latipinna TaxID=48699 RepID=A0A3B3V253_9TELE